MCIEREALVRSPARLDASNHRPCSATPTVRGQLVQPVPLLRHLVVVVAEQFGGRTGSFLWIQHTQQPQETVHLVDRTGEVLVPIPLRIGIPNPHEEKATYDQPVLLLGGAESATELFGKITGSKHHDTPSLS